MNTTATTKALADTTSAQQATMAAALLEQAAVLQELAGAGTLADALAEITRQVAVAGLPAGGAGMAADHEWTEAQFAALEAAG